MESVFVYWDNSNLFHEAQRLAAEREDGPDARYRVRIDHERLFHLAHASRPVQKAVTVGPVLPELRQLWNRMEGSGIEAQHLGRGDAFRSDQETPHQLLQLSMLEDALDFTDDPGIAVVLTGDGTGYYESTGFHSTLERMRKRGWSRGQTPATRACADGRKPTAFRVFGRFLRRHHVPRAVQAWARIGGIEGSGGTGSFEAANGGLGEKWGRLGLLR